jgi:hypothetical protein
LAPKTKIFRRLKYIVKKIRHLDGRKAVLFEPEKEIT